MHLDLAGRLDVVDGVEGLLHGLSQRHDAVIPQHQDLHVTTKRRRKQAPFITSDSSQQQAVQK